MVIMYQRSLENPNGFSGHPNRMTVWDAEDSEDIYGQFVLGAKRWCDFLPSEAIELDILIFNAYLFD